jgi:hypothetical protein
MGASHMEHVNFVFSDGEQYTITAHNHLTNFFFKLIVLRRKREAFRNEGELSGR